MRIAALLLAAVALCGQGVKSTLVSLVDAPNTPVDSPGAGTYSSTQSVTITDATAQFILYTTSGSTPACPATGTLYSGAFNISVTTTLKAIGCNGVTGGGVLTSVYTISSGIAPIPTCAGTTHVTVNTAATVSGMDCTGATSIVVWAPTYNASTTPTSSPSNTFVGLTAYNAGSITGQFYYVCGPSVNSSMSVTLPAQASTFNTVFIQGFSGTLTSGCVAAASDKGAANASVASYSPAATNYMLLAGTSDISNGTTHSITSTPSESWTVSNDYNAVSGFVGGALAYFLYPSTSGIVVNYTNSGANAYVNAIIALIP